MRGAARPNEALQPTTIPAPLLSATRRLAVAVAATLAFACGGPDALGPRADVAGTYVLATIDDGPLPQYWGFSSPASGHSLLLADTLTLVADGSYRRVLIVRHWPGYNDCIYPSICNPDPDRRFEESGTWGVRGAAITLRLAGEVERVRRGTVSGDGTLAYTDPDHEPRAGTYVYHR